jgi:hypothetical protein
MELDAGIDKKCWKNDYKYNNGSWTLQKNKYLNLYRVVGPDDKVKAKGNRSTMIEKMKRLIRHEFLQPGDVLGVSRNMGLLQVMTKRFHPRTLESVKLICQSLCLILALIVLE